MAIYHSCEICGEKAPVHVTEGSRGAAIMRHFCEEHAPPELAVAMKGRSSVKQMYQDLTKSIEDAIVEYEHRDMDAEKKEKALVALNTMLAICREH